MNAYTYLQMAYYTLVPWLHKDIFGAEKTDANISPDLMTPSVWDFVFAITEDVPDSTISKETLLSMRRSFQYW
jgi:leucyl-tRNA synthetase